MDRRRPSDEETDDWDAAWVETDALDRWQPPVEERVRAGAIIASGIGVLLILAVVMAVAPGGGDGDRIASADATTSTTEDVEITALSTLPPTTAPPDPASVGGAPPPERCAEDDRGGLELRPLPAVEVLVLNATPRAGHAGDITDTIAGLGYRTATPGNAGREPVTIIRHTTGWCAEADRLATELRLPEARLEAVPRGGERDPGSSDLVVVVGSDSL